MSIMAFGDIVKVTPSSKVVGDMAIFLVNHGMTVEQFGELAPDHTLTLPNSVIECLMGSLGEPEGGWPPKMQAIILRGAKPATDGPANSLPPIDLEETARRWRRKSAARSRDDELLSYLMYPGSVLEIRRRRVRHRECGSFAHAAILLRNGAAAGD